MKIINTKIKGLKIIQQTKHGDNRGYLRDTFRKRIIKWDQLIWEYPEKGNFSPFYQNEEGEGELEVSNLPPNFSWVHISYIVGDNEKINSVSSTNPKIHKAYKDENTFYLGDFTHKIALANQQLLIP